MDPDTTSLLAESLTRLARPLRQVPLGGYQVLEGYTRSEIHEGLQGQGGLFLASDMCKRLPLVPGMKVLDLGSGRGATSVFMARHYGVRVFAVDEFEPESVFERKGASKVRDLITSIRADARRLPFSEGFFDAIFCMNALFYFGTDDLFPPYLLRFLKPKGEMVVGGPCYRRELTDDTPRELLVEFPACFAVHSPDWWRKHFENCREAEVLHSEVHPLGVEFWEDRVRTLLDLQTVSEMSEGRRRMIIEILRMLERDREGFVTHFIMHLRKTRPSNT